MKQVSIYSTPACGYCEIVKNFFQKNKIEYTDYNIMADKERRDEMIKKTGQMGLPVIIIDKDSKNEEIIIGFDKKHLSYLLGL